MICQELEMPLKLQLKCTRKQCFKLFLTKPVFGCGQIVQYPSHLQDMKNIMKQFQVYLASFEGTMVVRINKASSFPVAIEMQQSCSLSDAWMLLGRLMSSGGVGRRSQLDPIILQAERSTECALLLQA